MKSRRFVFVVIVALLVGGAIAAGTASSASRRPSLVPAVGPSAAVVAPSNAVWFCPGLPPALPHDAGRVTFANLGAATADVVVTDLADNGNPTQASVEVPSNSVLTRTRDQLGGPGALTVETFGGRVVVEEGIEGRVLETTPCASETSTHWYFAAGSTPRGVQQWLVLDNPYASDAKVDVTLRTSSGVLRPGTLQGLDVARRSREVVSIHDVAVRQDRVAVAVDTEVGAVVAAQTIVYTPTAGTPGVALSLGAPTTATDWTFAGATARPGATALVAIANVGNDDAQVDVQATAESTKQALAPVTVAVAQDAVTWVTLGRCSAANARSCIAIPDGVRYSLDVRSEQNVSIVAQTLTRYDDAPTAVGVVTSAGATVPARAWAFARSRVQGEQSTELSFFNPSAGPAVVSVGLVHGGRVDRPAALARVRVPPGRAVTVVVVGGRKPATFDAALTIDASVPVYVERSIIAAGDAANSVGAVVG